MNYLKILILSILKNNQRDGVTRAMTVVQLTEELANKKNITVYKALQELHEGGYVEKGLKNGRATTYYINQKGINTYLELGGK